MMMSKLIFNEGIRFRNPSLAHNLAFLKESESWSLDRLKEYQLERCREVLTFAERHSNFYRETVRQSGFSVDGFHDLDLLKQLPAISKTDLIDHNEAIHTTDSYPFKKLFISETSGSTGEPLWFRKNESWDSWNRAAAFRGYSWHGVEPSDRNGYFWGYNIDPSKAWKTKLLDALQNRFRLFSYDPEEVRTFIRRLRRATYLHGYSSMVYEVARVINEEGLNASDLNLKMVKGTSEKIHEHYQPEIKKAFGRNMISEYGAAEAGIIAFECTHGRMHLNMEGCIVEEEEGEIVVTNLNAFSFPIIRYQLGDYIQLEDEGVTCSCGMAHPVLREVTGRVGSKIFGKKKTYPSLTIYYVLKNIFLGSSVAVNAQFVQRKKGNLSVRVEGKLDDSERKALDQEMNTYFGNDMQWMVEENVVIHSKNGKRRDFISEIIEE